jgi:hypothetical protein
MPIKRGANALIVSTKSDEGASPKPTMPASVSTWMMAFDVPGYNPADQHNGISSGIFTGVAWILVILIVVLSND